MKKIYITIGAVLSLGVLIGMLITASLNVTSLINGQSREGLVLGNQNYQPNKASIFLKKMNLAFREIVSTVKPTVVGIEVETKAKSSNKQFRDFDDGSQFPFFFFRKPDKNMERPMRGSGSGVIISSDGYILTNNHVIEPAKDGGKILVVLDDKREFDAKIVGTDPLTDIAVLKVDASDLPSIAFGNSSDVQVGDFVLAIGNPFRLRSTVTAGIVSASGRNINIIQDSYGVEYFIQTDAAINSGNSGGALIDVEGRLIGINTAIATNTGNYQGYGFAIPINLAKAVAENLINDGKIVRGYMGVSIRSLDATTAKALGLKKPRGVFVDNVLENSGAEDAGIQPGDVILEIEGKQIREANELQVFVLKQKPGKSVKLKVWRKGKDRVYYVKLKPRYEKEKAKMKPSSLNEKNDSDEEFNDERLGITVKSMTYKEKKKNNIKTGVKVINVRAFSPASKRGIQKNDIILQVQYQDVKDVNSFSRKIESKKPGTAILLRLKRGEKIFFVAVQIPKT